jgi:hypothetical protein
VDAFFGHESGRSPQWVISRSERLEKLVAAIQAEKGESRFRTLDVTSREWRTRWR